MGTCGCQGSGSSAAQANYPTVDGLSQVSSYQAFPKEENKKQMKMRKEEMIEHNLTSMDFGRETTKVLE
jgi:hypothetical protein